MQFEIKTALRVAALSLALVGTLGQASAATTIYTDEAAFDAAVGAQITEQFSAPSNGFTFQGTTYATPQFVITDLGSSLYTVDSAFDPLYQWNSGAVLDAEFGALTSTTSASALGFNFGNPALRNSDSNTININGVEYGGYSQPTFAFYGITSTDGPVSPVTVNFNGGLGIIDNVTTGVVSGVPEPSTWLMMLLGFGGIAFFAYRKSQKNESGSALIAA